MHQLGERALRLAASARAQHKRKWQTHHLVARAVDAAEHLPQRPLEVHLCRHLHPRLRVCGRRVLHQHAVKAADHAKPARAEALLPLQRVVQPVWCFVVTEAAAAAGTQGGQQRCKGCGHWRSLIRSLCLAAAPGRDCWGLHGAGQAGCMADVRGAGAAHAGRTKTTACPNRHPRPHPGLPRPHALRAGPMYHTPRGCCPERGLAGPQGSCDEHIS